jgi:hypothetical protein
MHQKESHELNDIFGKYRCRESTCEACERLLFSSRKERCEVAEGEGAKLNTDSTLNTPLYIHKGMMFE